MSGPLRVSIDIESARRVELSLDLRARGTGQALRVQDLRASGPDTPRLQGVRVLPAPGDEERLCVRVRIPDGQPPGDYSGLILDEAASLPCGVLRVRLLTPG